MGQMMVRFWQPIMPGVMDGAREYTLTEMKARLEWTRRAAAHGSHDPINALPRFQLCEKS